jgi:hypothetical protein
MLNGLPADLISHDEFTWLEEEKNVNFMGQKLLIFSPQRFVSELNRFFSLSDSPGLTNPSKHI